MELSRGDGSLATFLGVQAGLAMRSIAMLGSEEQKQRWLPPMSRLEKLGAFALTEPDHGSDSIGLETTARRDGDCFVTNGHKKWIGNGSIADVVVVRARDTADGQVKGFLVERGSRLRRRADLRQAPTPVRQAPGQLPAHPEPADHDAGQGHLDAAVLPAAGRPGDGRRARPTLARLAKAHNTSTAREVLADARDLLGGNGILLHFHVIRHMVDIESIHTYEGTEAMQTLIVGRDITGVSAFT